MKIPEVSIILPCLNEEQAIGTCIDEIKRILKERNLNAEIIVVDNGSKDRSVDITRRKGAKVFFEPRRGYGAACLKGFNVANGKYLLLVDADCSYDFSYIPRFISQLKRGYELVIGNRFKGKIESGSMPLLHRYLGNPLLSLVLRVFFKSKVGDAHCGMRAIRKSALKKLDLRATGMEFASEMVILATKNNLKIKEIPIDYYKRRGNSKLKTFSDGWRHLRFMLLYSPFFLFFIPGLIIFLLGFFTLLLLYFFKIRVFGLYFYYHPMFFSASFVIVGYQLIVFALFAKTYALTHLGDDKKFEKIYKYITLERTLLFGFLLFLAGTLMFFYLIVKWLKSGFGALSEIKNSIIALTLLLLGIQTIFSSFMLSILGIKRK